MEKINWKIIIITCIVCLLPTIAGIILYDKLPAQMAVHFGIDNKPDSYASKAFALFGIPAFLVLVQIICCIISDITLNEKAQKTKFIGIIKWFIPIISIVVNTTTIGVALGYAIDVRKYVLSFIGIVFMVLGYYMPKISYEEAKVMMHPTPKNEEVYKRMSKMLGDTFVISGLLLIVSVFGKPITSVIVIILFIFIILIESIYYLVRDNRIKI